MKLSLEKAKAEPPQGAVWLRIPHRIISVLKQIRTRMSADGLEKLEESIKSAGQLSQGIIAAFRANEAKKYLAYVNEVQAANHTLDEFTPIEIVEKGGELYYLFLVAGHRRHRAVASIDIDYFCQVHFELSPEKALALQFQENFHEQVDPAQEARYLAMTFRIAKKASPKLSAAAFAKKNGIRVEKFMKMVKFAELPVSIQELLYPNEVRKDHLSFGVLCELARLHVEGKKLGKIYTERELHSVAFSFVAHRRSLRETSKQVSLMLDALRGDPDDIFAADLDAIQQNATQLARTGTEHGLQQTAFYIKRVSRFVDGEGQPMVVSGSVNTTLARLAEAAGAVNEATMLTRSRGARRGRSAIKEMKDLGTA